MKGVETHESLAAMSSHVPADSERGFPGKWVALRVAEHIPDEPHCVVVEAGTHARAYGGEDSPPV